MSLSPYLYADSNPVMHEDPSGLASLVEVKVILGTIANLSRLGIQLLKFVDKAQA